MPQCEGKCRYPSRLVALMNAVKALGRKENPPEALRPYRCKVCKGWHLTSRVDPEERGYAVRRVTSLQSENSEGRRS